MGPDSSTNPLLLSLEEACRKGNISRSALYRAARAGEIAIVKRGTRSFVLNESLTAYVARLVSASARGGAQ